MVRTTRKIRKSPTWTEMVNVLEPWSEKKQLIHRKVRVKFVDRNVEANDGRWLESSEVMAESPGMRAPTLIFTLE